MQQARGYLKEIARLTFFTWNEIGYDDLIEFFSMVLHDLSEPKTNVSKLIVAGCNFLGIKDKCIVERLKLDAWNTFDAERKQLIQVYKQGGIANSVDY